MKLIGNFNNGYVYVFEVEKSKYIYVIPSERSVRVGSSWIQSLAHYENFNVCDTCGEIDLCMEIIEDNEEKILIKLNNLDEPPKGVYEAEQDAIKRLKNGEERIVLDW